MADGAVGFTLILSLGDRSASVLIFGSDLFRAVDFGEC